MRLVALWSRLSGFFLSCLKTFAETYDAELLVIAQPTLENAPFANEEFEWIPNLEVYQDGRDYQKLRNIVREFQPDSILMSSWNFRDYMRLARSEPFRMLPRISMTDNQWHGTVKQYFGKIISPFFLKPSIDGFFVPGERQAEFCRNLGYDFPKIMMGSHSCDVRLFSEANQVRKHSPLPKTFLYVGRMVPEKGISVLAEAYQLYREQVTEPYQLICVGTGPLANTLSGIDGVEMKGFVQPRGLPEIFSQASCLLLPSLFEPWGLVIHEATVAGLAVICTHTCGAAVHLVQGDFNGYLISPEDPRDLAAAMVDYSKKTDPDRIAISKNSQSLSLQFTPERWASSLYKALERVRSQKPYSPTSIGK